MTHSRPIRFANAAGLRRPRFATPLWLTTLLTLLDVWDQRQRTRRQLLTLDDVLLRDIGIDRIDARREADKPFWRA